MRIFETLVEAELLGSGAEEIGLLVLVFNELLLAVHLDDEWDDEDEEGGAGDPGGLASATEELLGDEGGFGGSALGVVDDGGLGHGAANPRDQGLLVVVALGQSLFPLRRCHYNHKITDSKGYFV
jgi:hypothetical protein|uniref:Uncharacterized protein n=1 Tax=Fagus sylvatica TaxID=28930 RepID=A0A2N9FS40_FAGSY